VTEVSALIHIRITTIYIYIDICLTKNIGPDSSAKVESIFWILGYFPFGGIN